MSSEYAPRLDLGPIARFWAGNFVNCPKCCYVQPGYPSWDNPPVINGTHMINGTEITPVTREEIGYTVLVKDIEGDFNRTILPCSRGIYVSEMYYYQKTSDVMHLKPGMKLLVVGLVLSMLLV